MFRWLKGKKPRKSDCKKSDTEDDYGFRKRRSPDNSDYGFKDRPPFVPESDLQESIYHIYEEIPDLPDLRLSSDRERRNHQQQTTGDVSRRPGLDLDRAVEVGPYLIVPIVGRIYEQDDIEIFKKDENINVQNNECNSCSCNCPTRVQTLPRYNTPWEFNENLNNVSQTTNMSDRKVVLTRAVKSRTTFSLSELDPLKNPNSLTIDVTDELEPAKSKPCMCTSESDSGATDAGTHCVISESEPERGSWGYLAHTDSEDGNDTCCEYDMSTSSESDVAENLEYQLYLSRVERNLLMKHDVKRLLTKTDVDNNNENASWSDQADVDSITTVSSLSGDSSTPGISCEEVSDPDVPADRSESDDSSGYYECAEDSLKPEITSSSSSSVTVATTADISPNKTHKVKDKSGNNKHNHKKSKSHHSAKLKYKHVIQCSDDDKEMYLIPTNKRSSTSFKLPAQRAPLLPPEQTLIYQDPCRVKRGSQNRLLSDLIRMNYNRQLLIH